MALALTRAAETPPPNDDVAAPRTAELVVVALPAVSEAAYRFVVVAFVVVPGSGRGVIQPRRYFGW